MTAWIATRWHKNGNISKYVAATQPNLETRLRLVRWWQFGIPHEMMGIDAFLSRQWTQLVVLVTCTDSRLPFAMEI